MVNNIASRWLLGIAMSYIAIIYYMHSYGSVGYKVGYCPQKIYKVVYCISTFTHLLSISFFIFIVLFN